MFASPGWRTTGSEAVNFLVTPPGWTGVVFDSLTRIKAPTLYVWIIGRTKTDGPVDYEAVAILTLVLYSCASMRGEAGSGTYLHAL